MDQDNEDLFEEYDPFIYLPEEIIRNILKCMDAFDLLQISLVSKRWYAMIGKSKDYMKNFKLTYNYMNNEKDIEFILNSGRLYQDLKILFFKTDLQENREIVKNTRLIVNKFSSSLISIDTTFEIQRILDLPKLKELKYYSFEDRYYRSPQSYHLSSIGLLGKATSLEKLVFECEQLDKISVKILKQKLKKMDCLKVLKINEESFMKDWKEYKFQLEVFYWTKGLYLKKQEILTNFLRTHSSTVTEIRFPEADSQSINLFLTCFPKLQKLCLKFNYQYESMNFDSNETITELDIENDYDYFYWRNSVSLKIIELIINLIPKLKSLEKLQIHYLNNEIIDAIMASNSIENVEYRTIERSTEQSNFGTTHIIFTRI